MIFIHKILTDSQFQEPRLLKSNNNIIFGVIVENLQNLIVNFFIYIESCNIYAISTISNLQLLYNF